MSRETSAGRRVKTHHGHGRCINQLKRMQRTRSRPTAAVELLHGGSSPSYPTLRKGRVRSVGLPRPPSSQRYMSSTSSRGNKRGENGGNKKHLVNDGRQPACPTVMGMPVTTREDPLNDLLKRALDRRHGYACSPLSTLPRIR